MAIASNGYQSGFGNEFASEAIAGTLPHGRNSPQVVAHGLYAEQISGTAFTAPRHQNRRSWLYRIRPAAMHGEFGLLPPSRFHNDFGTGPVTPDQLRWDPLPMPAGMRRWREVLNSDSSCYGGSNQGNAGHVLKADAQGCMHLVLPPLATLFLVPA